MHISKSPEGIEANAGGGLTRDKTKKLELVKKATSREEVSEQPALPTIEELNSFPSITGRKIKHHHMGKRHLHEVNKPSINMQSDI